MTITRSGANQAYSENWAKAFGSKKSKPSAPAKRGKKTVGRTGGGKSKKR